MAISIPEQNVKEQEEMRKSGADPNEYLKHPKGVVLDVPYRLAYQGRKQGF
jgi:hypothetical protein